MAAGAAGRLGPATCQADLTVAFTSSSRSSHGVNEGYRLSGKLVTLLSVARHEEILGQLDDAAKEFTFADLNHPYNYTIDARLHAFRDSSRWALLIETVGYNPRAGNVVDILHFFGDCLTEGRIGFEDGDFLNRVENMAEIEDGTNPEYLLVSGGPIQVRGQRITVEAQEGDELEDVFRLLVPQHRELLFADESEIRRRLPADLPRILVLDEWWQPDLYEMQPSATETFQQLARVLATGDVCAYRPTLRPNTHWSHWPDSGVL
jgi:hypothetical protein